jgi:integrase
VGPGGEKTRRDYESKGEAQKVKICVERELRRAQERTIGEAKAEYMQYMREVKGNKRVSVHDVMYRLDRFFVEVDDRGKVHDLGDVELGGITPARGEALYASLRSCKTRNGGTLSVDSHRTILAAAKTFFRWCVVEKKWLVRSPLENVKGIGKVRHGKEQLRIDEARRWMVEAQRQADLGHAGAVAAMMALVMGMRASEIVSRVVRDLDDDGTLLWIPDSKTLAGRRKLQIPELLQPYLVKLAEGRGSQAALFGGRWRDWPRRWVQRICKAAGVPEVTAHGMRGLHGTLAVDSGITSHAVASALGHESFKTTAESYAKREAVAGVQQRRALAVLTGGRVAS